MPESYDIRYDFLSDQDSDRLYAQNPMLKASSEEYCPTCQKTGTYFWAGEEHDCDCFMQLQLHKHYLRAGIGLPYQVLDWSDYIYHPDAKAAAQQYLARCDRLIPRGRGMILSGPNGTGKTLLATLVLKDLVKRGYDCYASTFADTITALTAGWYDKGDKDWFARRFMYSQVLLLDDVGKERSTNNALPETTFDNLLRTRVQAGRVTLLSTNLDVKGLDVGYGRAALSLLTEVNSFFELTEVDIRRAIMDRNQVEELAGEMRPIF